MDGKLLMPFLALFYRFGPGEPELLLYLRCFLFDRQLLLWTNEGMMIYNQYENATRLK
jgi:hypothetical protein